MKNKLYKSQQGAEHELFCGIYAKMWKYPKVADIVFGLPLLFWLLKNAVTVDLNVSETFPSTNWCASDGKCIKMGWSSFWPTYSRQGFRFRDGHHFQLPRSSRAKPSPLTYPLSIPFHMNEIIAWRFQPFGDSNYTMMYILLHICGCFYTNLVFFARLPQTLLCLRDFTAASFCSILDVLSRLMRYHT